MPTKPKPARSPQRKPGSPDDGAAPKFRNKILGLSVADASNPLVHGGDDSSIECSSSPSHNHPGAQDHAEYLTQMEQELARRQESYVRRERQYKVRICELEAQVFESRAKKAKESSVDATMDHLRQMHRTIIDNVDNVQDRTSKILQEQEKDLLRAFRARLYSVQEELESEKNKTDDGASAWIEKSKQLETEVEWTKELADRLDRLNQSLTRENQRLKTQFTTQENDREFLVKQLVTVKKDNVRLRNEVESLQRQMQDTAITSEDHHHGSMGSGSSLGHGLLHHASSISASSMSALPRVAGASGAAVAAGRASNRPTTAIASGLPGGNSPFAMGGAGAAAAAEADNRYKEIIKRLKRVLDVERRNLQQVRSAYKNDLQNRTELEMILKECIHDVRAEIASVSAAAVAMPPVARPVGSANNNKHSSGSSGSGAAAVLLMGGGAVERQKLIEKLLTKERILNLLTTKAFPIKTHKNNPSNDPLLTGDAISQEEMTKMYAEVASLTAATSDESR